MVDSWRELNIFSWCVSCMSVVFHHLKGKWRMKLELYVKFISEAISILLEKGHNQDQVNGTIPVNIEYCNLF